MKYIFVISLLFIIISCNTHKKLVYFQEEISSSKNNINYTPTFKTDDLLSIIISGDSPEAAIPFNLAPSGTTQTLNSGYSTGNTERTGYLIDNTGNIHMPILGNISLIGLTRVEATILIKEQLVQYISNPIVNIQVLNFKISVLGDVNQPGTFRIPNERITLLEAIGLSGDLNITGNRKNVLIIRDVNGEKEEFRVDLTSSDVFSSNAYYLEQNDVVYIEPNKASRNNSTVWKTSGSIFLSSIALVITTVNLLLIK